MAKNTSIWGPVDERIRTDIRIPVELDGQVQYFCDLLGVTKNTFYIMGVVFYMVTILPVVGSDQKRSFLSRKLSALFQKAISAVS